MTAYSVTSGDTAFANVSRAGVGMVVPGVMTWVATATLASSDTVAFTFPHFNGLSIKGVIPFCNATYNVVGTYATGTNYDTVTVTAGAEIAADSIVGIYVLLGM